MRGAVRERALFALATKGAKGLAKFLPRKRDELNWFVLGLVSQGTMAVATSRSAALAGIAVLGVCGKQSSNTLLPRTTRFLTPLTRWQAVTKGSEARPRIFVSTDESQMTTAKKQTAFNRALAPSAELAAVIGATPQPRTEVVKLMWEYIKANNLQNPKNKRNILADAKLKAVFGKDEVTMFEMTGLVGKHLS